MFAKSKPTSSQTRASDALASLDSIEKATQMAVQHVRERVPALYLEIDELADDLEVSQAEVQALQAEVRLLKAQLERTNARVEAVIKEKGQLNRKLKELSKGCMCAGPSCDDMKTRGEAKTVKIVLQLSVQKAMDGIDKAPAGEEEDMETDGAM